MTLSFKARFAALVGWQLLLLLLLMGSRWAILARGTTVVLGTLPVDPRELFRGEYVALRYEISALNPARLAPGGRPSGYDPGAVAYVVVMPPPRGSDVPWHAVALLNRKPTEEERAGYHPEAVALRGQVTGSGESRVEIQYGIESYFVPEGEALPLERAAGSGLTAEVKVDAEGRAAIHRLLLHGRPVPRSGR